MSKSLSGIQRQAGPGDATSMRSSFLEFQHAVSTFKPGEHSMDDLPKQLPIFNWKTGKYKRASGLEPERGRRVISMPPLPSLDRKVSKYLPDLPQSNGKRTVSLNFENYKLKQHTAAFSKPPPTIFEEDERPHINPTSVKLESTHNIQLPQIMALPSDDDSTLFSDIPTTTVSSLYESSDDMGSDTKSGDSSELQSTSSGATSDIISCYVDINDLQQWDTNTDYEVGSYIDSLFGSDYDEADHATHVTSRASKMSQMSKALPSIPHSENEIRVNKLRKGLQETCSLPLVNNSRGSMISDNRSLSLSPIKSISDSKHEIKSFVRQRPYSACLDLGDNYNYSRYNIPHEKKGAMFRCFNNTP
ncbi:uncharacterized protein PRCAT00000071001 [Priceomyces carsonii]|uniref:uncharacterized protein n=1 Tax=Priceomyces carsonii TaxID=28549 RepID=UPI002EDAA60C|nr:unnamed protein product [Priceomyces carsonii]